MKVDMKVTVGNEPASIELIVTNATIVTLTQGRMPVTRLTLTGHGFRRRRQPGYRHKWG